MKTLWILLGASLICYVPILDMVLITIVWSTTLFIWLGVMPTVMEGI